MKKTVTKDGRISVTFELPAEVGADEAVVLGDFNDWTKPTHMRRRKDGSRAATLRLRPGRYRYRYLLDGSRWENDWSADEYEPNGYGSDDSILVI
jgi:1,4-alpha-glucan branching enzyme